MRTPSDQSMMRAVALGLVLLAFGCTDSKAVAPSTPSPLLAMDEDRLWLLLWARDDMNPGCGKFYADPNDPRYADRRLPCARWEASTLEMLRANDVSEVGVEHLREAGFWNWYYAKGASIGRCVGETLKAADSATAAGLKRRLSCDPYRRLTQLERRTVADAGIRLP